MMLLSRLPPIRPVVRLLSPGGQRGKLSVFIFHRVLPKPDPLLQGLPTATEFDWIVHLIARSFSVLPLDEAVQALAEGSLPPAAASITFDDGYADNLTVAAPILRRNRVSATFFIATAFLDGGRMWNDDVIEATRLSPPGILDWREFGIGEYELSDLRSRRLCFSTALSQLKSVPHEKRTAVAREIARRAGLSDRSNLMLTSDQLIELRACGMQIGAHTHTHPILENLPDAIAEREITEGRNRLEVLLGEPVSLFAYPNGIPGRDYSARHVELVKRLGFAAAVSTAQSVARSGTDLHQLPRFTPWDRTPMSFGLRCVRSLLPI